MKVKTITFNQFRQQIQNLTLGTICCYLLMYLRQNPIIDALRNIPINIYFCAQVLKSKLNNILKRIPPKMMILQYLWVFSHLLTLCGTITYFNYLFSKDSVKYANLCYLSANIGAIFTYSLVLYRHIFLSPVTISVDLNHLENSNDNIQQTTSFANNYYQNVDMNKNRVISMDNCARPDIFEDTDPKCNNEIEDGYINMPLRDDNINTKLANSLPYRIPDALKSENAQLFSFALLWLFSSQNIFKLLPFAIYSLLNLCQFLIQDVFFGSSFSLALCPLIEYVEVPLLITAAHIDNFFNFAVLFRESIKCHNGYVLVLYTYIWSLRISSSNSTRASFHQIMRLIESLVINPLLPQSLQSVWLDLKILINGFIPIYEYPEKVAQSEMDMNYSDKSFKYVSQGSSFEEVAVDFGLSDINSESNIFIEDEDIDYA